MRSLIGMELRRNAFRKAKLPRIIGGSILSKCLLQAHAWRFSGDSADVETFKLLLEHCIIWRFRVFTDTVVSNRFSNSWHIWCSYVLFWFLSLSDVVIWWVIHGPLRGSFWKNYTTPNSFEQSHILQLFNLIDDHAQSRLGWKTSILFQKLQTFIFVLRFFQKWLNKKHLFIFLNLIDKSLQSETGWGPEGRHKTWKRSGWQWKLV